MKRSCLFLLCALIACGIATADDTAITIKGMVLNNVHTGQREKSVFIYALDGTPEIRAELEKILVENYPDRGIDADAAQKLQDQFTARLKYFIIAKGNADYSISEIEYIHSDPGPERSYPGVIRFRMVVQ
jgi:hypothetical protein